MPEESRECPVCGGPLIENEVDDKTHYACPMHGNMTEAFEDEAEG